MTDLTSIDLTIIGSGRWPDHLAKLLHDHSDLQVEAINIRERDWPLKLAKGSGPMLRVGLRPGASNRNGRLFDAVWRLIIAVRRRSVAYYWIGTDVWDSINAGDQIPKWALDAPHWVGAPWFANELAPLGIAADNVWFPTDSPGADRSASVMPTGTFIVSSYVPAFNADLYGWPFIQDVARALPAIEFEVFGDGSERLKASPNVSLLGEVANGAAVIERSHVHLRPTKHDAFAGTVREALALSRYVAFSQPLDGVFTIDQDHTESTIDWLGDLADIHDHGGLAPNTIGRKALDHLFGDNEAIRVFAAKCTDLVESARVR